MSNLDPRIEAVRAKYDLSKDDFWQIPQNKQWVCKHAALEIVAVKAGIRFSMPQIIEANTEAGIAVMAVSGEMDGRVEWATGEASPKNNKNAYPWAMSEKRSKDRVVLKLAGIHGLVYSEDEAEDFRAARPAPSEREAEIIPPKPPTTRTVAAEKAKYKELKDEMTKESANGSKAMRRWVNDKSVLADIEGLERYSEDFKQEFREVLELAEIAERELGEPAQVSRSLPDFSNMEPNDLPEETREAIRNFGG